MLLCRCFEYKEVSLKIKPYRYFRECSTSARTHIHELVGDKPKESGKRHPSKKISPEKSGTFTKHVTRGGVWK